MDAQARRQVCRAALDRPTRPGQQASRIRDTGTKKAQEEGREHFPKLDCLNVKENLREGEKQTTGQIDTHVPLLREHTHPPIAACKSTKTTASEFLTPSPLLLGIRKVF